MPHPIVTLQGALKAALAADGGLIALIGEGAVFDAPPRGRNAPPYVVIARHDVLPRDGDDAPGFEHRVTLQCWSDQPSRKAALAIAERVLDVAMSAEVGGDLLVTHRWHERTDTEIDGKTGYARAAVGLRFFSEAA